MRSVHCGPATGLFSQLALLPVLAVTVGLGGPGWAVGIAYAVTVYALLSGGIARRGSGGFGPADWVTLSRAVLAGGAAALVADSFSGLAPVALLAAFAALTIALDAVDGWLARRTGTMSELGARFDMEVDAFLIFALSVYVAPRIGAWVLLIGLARYVFVAAGWFLPWLRAGGAPPRYWSKVVAVIQGVVLTAAAAGIVPGPAIDAVLVLALALLVESFAHEAWWLWRRRHAGPVGGGRLVKVPAAALVIPAVLAIWLVLVVPARLPDVTPSAFVAIPLAAVALLLAALALPPAFGRTAALVVGVLLGLLVILKALNMGFFAAFDRPFDPVNDWYYLGPGLGVLGDSVGGAGAAAVVVAVVLSTAGALVLMPLAVRRLFHAVQGSRRRSFRAAVVLGLAWIVCAATGLQLSPGVPVAATGTAALVYGQFHQLQQDVADRNTFAARIADDPQAGAPADHLLSALHGKDVLLVFVESYGRSAVQDSTFSPGVDAVLAAGNAQLQAAGFSARSAFLTSPTFGGLSWLAHSTLQSGLRVDSQQRYNQLLTSQRLTLSRAFSSAGWRTVSDVPSDTVDWPQGAAFYGFDALYDARNVGYRGPKFSYATMPDQYVLSAFQRLELAPGHAPVMAELDLVSSHTPWTPLPRLVPWGQVGDGSIFNGMPAEGVSPESVANNPAAVRALYGQSIEYSLDTLFSFVTAHPDPNLVLVVLGDHQPNAEVSGTDAGHDVPISIIAHDPAVLERISGWDWQAGMLPGPAAPAWPMEAFRDRFLAAYSPNVTLPASGGPAQDAGVRATTRTSPK